jgi:hypothetical protein
MGRHGTGPGTIPRPPAAEMKAARMDDGDGHPAEHRGAQSGRNGETRIIEANREPAPELEPRGLSDPGAAHVAGIVENDIPRVAPSQLTGSEHDLRVPSSVDVVDLQHQRWAQLRHIAGRGVDQRPLEDDVSGSEGVPPVVLVQC